MKKIITGIIGILLLSSTLMAQSHDIDEVHLVDETTYRGKVIEQKPGAYIRLLVEDTRDTMTFTMDEIDKLLRIPVVDAAPTNEEGIKLEEKDEKIFNQNAFSLLLHGAIGGGDVAFQGLGIGINYRVNRRLAVGLSTKYLGESSSSSRRPYQWQKIPVQAEVTYELQSHFDNRSAIYLRAGAGRSFTLNGDYTEPDSGESRNVTDGWSINPGIGYRLNISKNMGVLLEVSYLLMTDRIVDQNDAKVGNNNWSNVMFTGSIFF